jgi:hypothetical protein
MSKWTLSGNGNTAEFRDLGLGRLRRSRRSGALDDATFEAVGKDFNTAALFPYGSVVKIYKDDKICFSGTRSQNYRHGEPGSEGIVFRITGPWLQLQQCVYSQNWMLLNPNVTPPALALGMKSRVILNQDESGNRITNGAQIEDAINYAISKGANLQLGVVAPAVSLMFEECRDLHCDEVISKMMRWSPDCAISIDYSTDPPTFNVFKTGGASGLASPAVTVAYPDLVSRLNITPRQDLCIPGIVLKFEITNTKSELVEGGDPSEGGDTGYESLIVQSAGDIEALATVIATIPLNGSRETTISTRLETADWPGSTDEQGVFTAKAELEKADVAALDPWAAALRDDLISVTDVVRWSSGLLPRFLTKGTIPQWLSDMPDHKLDKPFKKVSLAESLTYNALVKTSEGTFQTNIATIERKVDFLSTDCKSKKYSKQLSFEAGDVIPDGLAAAVYAAWSILHSEGSVTCLQEECGIAIAPGYLLNVSGKDSIFAAMNALVHGVDEDVDNGITTISIGPPPRMSLDDYLAIATNFRNGRGAASAATRISGKTEDKADAVDVSGSVPAQGRDSHPQRAHKIMVTHKDDGATYIQLDPADLVALNRYKSLVIELDSGKYIMRPGWIRAHP